MSGTLQTPTGARAKRPLHVGGYSAALILVLGVVVVPSVVVMAAVSHTAPDTSDYIRMAFAQVAGATIAIVSSVALVIDRLVRRARWSAIAILAVIATVVTMWSIRTIHASADFLLAGIGLTS